MPETGSEASPVELDLDDPVWERVFTVAPLVLIGTREEGGAYNLAPKHMAFPLGWGNRFGFVCTPRHSTYRNIRREKSFAVCFPRPSQVLMASLAAGGRESDCAKPSLMALPTIPAERVEGVFIQDASLYLECELERLVDGFGDNSLVAGRIVSARAREDSLRRSERDDNELIYQSPLLAYLHPGRFASIESSQGFPFPEDFKK